MKRILIIGNVGSGKSTFSRKLGTRLKLPVIHLDRHFHQPNWTKPRPGDWDKILQELMEGKKWIMDGTYKRTLPNRLKKADTVIFLDTPKWLSLYRILKRKIVYRKSSRPDLPDYLEEKVSLGLLKKLFTFQKKYIQSLVEESGKEFILLRGKHDIEKFLNRKS